MTQHSCAIALNAMVHMHPMAPCGVYIYIRGHMQRSELRASSTLRFRSFPVIFVRPLLRVVLQVFLHMPITCAPSSCHACDRQLRRQLSKLHHPAQTAAQLQAKSFVARPQQPPVAFSHMNVVLPLVVVAGLRSLLTTNCAICRYLHLHTYYAFSSLLKC